MPQVSSASPLIEIVDLAIVADGRELVSGVSFHVTPGEIVTLIGPNGAGKTTVVRAALGLIEPARGRIARRRGLTVGYVPQRLPLDPSLPITVRRFLDLGLPRGYADRIERCRHVLEEVGAPETEHAAMDRISGGELQRVLLARALLRDPELLVLDEPVGGVDITGQAEIFALIGRVRDRRGLGVLLVSHDLHLVMAATDQVICLNQHVCCAGTPERVSRDPAFIGLFGDQVAAQLAVYHHQHDHVHDEHGRVVPLIENAAAKDAHVYGPGCGHDHHHGRGHENAGHG